MGPRVVDTDSQVTSMGRLDELWRVLMTIIVVLGLFVLVLATAKSNGLIVWEGTTLDLSVLLLTAATVVLTGVAVGVAVFAIWGYREAREAAIKSAVEIAAAEARKTARDVAQTVATRARFDPEPVEDGTTSEQAEQIVEALELETDQDQNGNA